MIALHHTYLRLSVSWKVDDIRSKLRALHGTSPVYPQPAGVHSVLFRVCNARTLQEFMLNVLHEHSAAAASRNFWSYHRGWY